MLDSNLNKKFALITSSFLSAKENMKIDKELFENFHVDDLPILRIYSWEKSFTYGFSQNFKSLKNLQHLLSYEDNHAKRITGGGILFHGNDISYSLVIPTSFVRSLSVKESYEMICSFLMTFYTSLHLSPIYAKDSNEISLFKSEFCQEGYEPYDILINGKKIGGNAQRRSKNIIFQHGSISINNSCYSLGNSLEDIGVNITMQEAKKLLIESFANTFHVSFEHKNKEYLHAS